MYRYLPIRDIYAREIIDSRGNPALEVEVLAGEETVGRASVPSGSLKGRYEAVELRDQDERYLGKGLERAVANVNDQLARAVIGRNVFDQVGLDKILIRTDGSKEKRNLGANALLGVSVAAARAAAKALKIPLYRYLGGMNAKKMPLPMINVFSGGAHGDNTLDFQELMIIPQEQEYYRERLRICAEIYQMLRQVLAESGLHTAVGEEGGFTPDLKDIGEALQILSEAAERAGYRMGTDFLIGLDMAASRLYDRENKKYEFSGEGKRKGHRISRSTEELTDYYEELTSAFPIHCIQDPLDAEDWEGWTKITEQLGEKIQLAGADLFASNTERLEKGILCRAANTIVIKMNQIGTLTETFDVIRKAKKAGYQVIISHRLGETEDTTIADLAVAAGAEQIETGALCRSERVAKYNRLLRIEEEIDL